MLQRIHRDFTRWREDMNFTLEWQEQNDTLAMIYFLLLIKPQIDSITRLPESKSTGRTQQ